MKTKLSEEAYFKSLFKNGYYYPANDVYIEKTEDISKKKIIDTSTLAKMLEVGNSPRQIKEILVTAFGSDNPTLLDYLMVYERMSLIGDFLKKALKLIKKGADFTLEEINFFLKVSGDLCTNGLYVSYEESVLNDDFTPGSSSIQDIQGGSFERPRESYFSHSGLSVFFLHLRFDVLYGKFFKLKNKKKKNQQIKK